MVSPTLQHVSIEPTFAAWRSAARRLLAVEAPPQQVIWSTQTPGASSSGMLEGLFAAATPDAPDAAGGEHGQNRSRVPRPFIELAKTVALHSDDDRWQHLYCALWRLTHGEGNLLRDAADPTVLVLQRMAKQVTRDAHKMKAFVRFRRIDDADGEQYVAFHRPDHYVLPIVGPFFRERFNDMRWTVLTPRGSMAWDGRELLTLPAASRSPVDDDDLETLWRTYYASIFNPARVKIKAMKNEMPVRHWRTMPEAALIPQLLRDAGQRANTMCQDASARREQAAWPYFPRERSLPQLRVAAQACRACEIGCHATQAVFGEGPADGRLMFVGEQPGDQEDLQGRPFVGPAGQVLDQALQAAGIERERCYVTNAVKHFKFTRGKRRLHARPSAREAAACRPWLEAELEIVRPDALVLLGATAAQSLLGANVRVSRDRGRFFASPWCANTFITLHPSALLRMPDEQARRAACETFHADFKAVAEHLRTIAPNGRESRTAI